MSKNVLALRELDATQVSLVGGKAANLGELTRLPEARVPDGCCITTSAYRALTDEDAALGAMIEALEHAPVERIAALAAAIRDHIEALTLPDGLVAAIRAELRTRAPEQVWAVRSSATAEDLPTASFAGQQDTMLGVVGEQAVCDAVRRCWASLFTERAVSYRAQHGIAHREVAIAVVIQEQLHPVASGVMFTADPITSHRQRMCIEAVPGLGEALVSGQVTPDTHVIQNDAIVERHLTIIEKPVLDEAQLVRLAALGRRVEAHFGAPQDIEWCMVGEAFHVVQSRPITTLFPIPQAEDAGHHIYFSVGHQQMMTDAMRPLGLSFYLMTTRAKMLTVGGRLYVEMTPMLTNPESRARVLAMMGRHDPLSADALATAIETGAEALGASAASAPLPVSLSAAGEAKEIGAGIPICEETVQALIDEDAASLEALREELALARGEALFDLIERDLPKLQQQLTRSFGVIKAAMDATEWLDTKMEAWLGERRAADVLVQSVPHNVTSQMGLDLLEVADVCREAPEVAAYITAGEHDDFLNDIKTLRGGYAAHAAIARFLETYGMRCGGEIDLTRTRWREAPELLAPTLASHIARFAPGEGERRFEQGRQQALRYAEELLERLRALPQDGEARAAEAGRLITLVRTFMGYREYPKYFMVSRYFLYKRALLEEAARWVAGGVLREAEEIFWFSFEELREVSRTGGCDLRLVEARRAAYAHYQRLTPPRVITSAGECLWGSYHREELPEGVLPGLGVSAGVVEGRARVVRRMEEASLEEGDILVTAFTDPSWTPLFVTIRGLVTEVGGMMTHGAVIAREYGLAAVVGVQGATTRIEDGQRIRVHGATGYVELL